MIGHQTEDKKKRNLGIRLFRPIIAVIGLIIWFVLILLNPLAWSQVVVVALTALFFALLLIFPIDFFGIEITLAQVTFLGIGLVFGVEVAAWAAIVGGVVGSVLRVDLNNLPGKSLPKIGIDTLYELGLVFVPFAVTTALLDWQQHMYLDVTSMAQFAGLYVICHSAIILMGIAVVNLPDFPKIRQVLPFLILIELLALPFIIISILVAPDLGLNSLVILGGMPTILTILLSDTQDAHQNLERRLQDLFLLYEFSSVVRHATNLKDLLNALHTQTTDLMGVGNFYVALYKPIAKTIWYPIAIKAGVSQEWVERPITNRLTDQVIEKGAPILLAGDIEAGLKKIGAPPSDGDLQAWLGVPLQTPEGLLGCLAVFSETPGKTFTEDDQILLSALSGQVSAALENILRLEEAGETLSRQAEQLNILDQIGRQLSATLEAKELFSQILEFALDFTHSPIGSISLREQRSDQFSTKAQVGEFHNQEEIDNLLQWVIQEGKPRIVKIPDFPGSQLCVPILHQNLVIGAITLQSDRPDEYSGNEMEFISQLSQQAALAIRNASLYEEAHFRLREQAILYLVSSRLVSAQNLEDVLTSVAESLSASLNSALTGIYLWSDDRSALNLVATMKRDEDQEISLPLDIPEAYLGAIHASDRELLLRSGESLLAQHLLAANAEQQVLLLPLRVSGELLGIVASSSHRDEAFSADDMQMSATIAAQGAGAIQNALLFTLITEGRDRLRAILDTVKDGVVMVDASGRVIISNVPIANLAGFTVQELIGKSLNSISPGFLQVLGLTSQQADLFTSRPTFAAQELSAPYQFKYSDRFYERYSAPVWSKESQILGWVLVIRDTTDENLLNQTREMLTETLVHDLRSPMGAIKTTLDILEENMAAQQQDPVSSQALDIAYRAADRVLGLVNSIMDISHLESNQLELELRVFDLFGLAKEIVADMLPQAREDRVMVSANLPEGQLMVKADQEIIRRILVNLLDNAVKFTPEGGLVQVSSQPLGDGKVQVSVTDTGPGIPEKYRQEVFSRFVQVPGVSGRRRGAGLGLAFCHVAIKAHGEQIWIEDGSGGKGTSMIFTLPIAQSQQ